jgi:hypothetical protein
MGWSYRKSFKAGPMRINLSKSGLGTSVGVKGARIGIDARGRSYSHVSIPGTGIQSRRYGSSEKRTKPGRKPSRIPLTLDDGREIMIPYETGVAILERLPKPRLKSGWALFFLWALTGLIGGHRYYLGRSKTALLQTLTLGGLGIWWAFDLLLLSSMLSSTNREIAERWGAQRIPERLLAEFGLY